MKLTLPRKWLLILPLLFSGIISAQNCPTVTSYNLVTVSNNGLGVCTYRVDFTMNVNGSNKSLQLIASCGGVPVLTQCIAVNSGQNGLTISSNTFTCACISSKNFLFNSFTNGSCGGASCSSTGNVLPVSISALQIKEFNGLQCLSWKVEEQINIQNYTIEYSPDGITFYSAGLVNAVASTEYRYCDPLKRMQGFYRLKIRETYGQEKYSSVVKFSSVKENTLAIYPNPATDKLNIEMPSSGGFRNAAYIIYSQDGSQVLTGNLTGSSLDVSKLSAGVYSFSLKTNGGMLLQKPFIKL